MEKIRKPFQGVWNVVRFNWHFYILSFGLVLILSILANNSNHSLQMVFSILVVGIVGFTLISLSVSCYIYDFSNLYKLNWLNIIKCSDHAKIVNINAGFDETSILIKRKFPHSDLIVFDFYDPSKHTEISIKRARKAYPPYPNTQQISTNHLPLTDNSTEIVFAILSAHEIRNDHDRTNFFKELKRVLIPTGKIIVTEHLRDKFNFFAYTIGFFHFHSKYTWIRTFKEAGLCIEHEVKITPFIQTFILNKNGTPS
ncbi:MAG: methyltransferase domain-containing protein [Saprospiraceae bacterium]